MFVFVRIGSDKMNFDKIITGLEYLSTLNTDVEENDVLLSGIVCTIGPATTNVNTLVKLMEAGMTVARLNFSHGSHSEHGQRITIIREAVRKYSKKLGRTYNLAIALDTKGPEIRTGILEQGSEAKIHLKNQSEVMLTADPQYLSKCNEKLIYLNYEKLTEVIKVGSLIYIDDGRICLQCMGINHPLVKCLIVDGGALSSKKGVHMPGIKLNLPAVSELDEQDLKFGIEKRIDMIFASFIRDARDVQQIRDALGKNGKNIFVVSKIENQEGLSNIDEIIEASDGIMVARGDLAVEISFEKVFVAQKSIIFKCNQRGKPVICATQMLESMTNKPNPSRPDTTDIANAILDGADCVMLSGETAVGNYPVKCVRMMAKICKLAEILISKKRLLLDFLPNVRTCDDLMAMAVASVTTSRISNAVAIITIASVGTISHLISKYRPDRPILMVTRNGELARQANLFKAVHSLLYEHEAKDITRDIKEQIEFALSYGKERGFIKDGDRVVTVVDSNENGIFSNGRFCLGVLTVKKK